GVPRLGAAGGGAPRLERRLPAVCTETPAIARDEPAEPVLGARRREIVPHRRAEGEELGRHHSAHRVDADVIARRPAAAVAPEAGQRHEAAGLERSADDVGPLHAWRLYAQPVTSQRLRANRAPIVAARAAMSTAIATHAPRTPRSRPTTIASVPAQATRATAIDPAMKRTSLAPIRIPSSANTAPLSGCTRANTGHRSAHWASTAASCVKTWGSTSRSESNAIENAIPRAIERTIIRTLASNARCGRPAPSSFPTMIWPAIATASSTSARNSQSWNDTWYAPSSASPIRATTAPASRNAAIRAVVRRKMNAPTDRSRSASETTGTRSARPTRRATSQMNPAPMHVWAMAVPHADPSIPQPKP